MYVELIILAALLVLIFGYHIVDNITDIRRRRNHPYWFDNYERAVELSSEYANCYNNRRKYFEFHSKELLDGLRDGECTEEYFMCHYFKICEQYVDDVKRYQFYLAEVDQLLENANQYAKVHNLKWGLLDD
ncbi:MAG: hypothetical protein IKL53_10265 [Lachnospiraceae bacterium]|nr:hypothetical protein [Lachnospiraceae bacterium]